MIFKCYFLQRAHSTKKTPFKRVFPSDTHFTAKSAKALRKQCLAQGHYIPMQPGCESTIAVSGNRHLTCMANMLKNLKWLNLPKNGSPINSIEILS